MDIVTKRICSVEGCEGKYEARGLCKKHYERLKKHGSIELSNPTLEERFWGKVKRSEGDKCWEWTACTTGGYGRIRIDGKSQIASRVAYQLFHGAIPDKLVVCHKCDNRKCVNPSHLFLGTLQDNNFDCLSKGRIARGEKARGARLKEAQVREILSSIETLSDEEASRVYGVTLRHIRDLRKGRAWKHLNPPHSTGL
jgi:hypothetical protein